MKQIQFREWKCNIEFDKYANNNRTCLRLVNADPIIEDDYVSEPGTEVIAFATVNISSHELNDDEVIIKDYSENEGMYEALFKAEVVGPVLSYAKSGFTLNPVCKLLIKQNE